MYDAQNEGCTKKSSPCFSSVPIDATTAITASLARRSALPQVASLTAGQPPPSAKTSPDPQGNLTKKGRGPVGPRPFHSLAFTPKSDSKRQRRSCSTPWVRYRKYPSRPTRTKGNVMPKIYTKVIQR